MNHFISGILKIVLLEGSIALLLIDLVAGGRFEKVRSWAHGVLAGLMVFAWCNYGSIKGGVDVAHVLISVPVILLCGFALGVAFNEKRASRLAALFPSKPQLNTLCRFLFGTKTRAIALVTVLSGGWVFGGVSAGKLPLVHPWEQFHFYLGAKYQRELGWFNLYKASILADRETVNVLGNMPNTRELTTFEQVPLDVAMRDAPQVRARFSDERWLAFKADWAAMAKLWPINWASVMNDHGNSNSPAWALLAAPITKLVPISANGQAFIGWIDMLLMLGLWLVVWQTFGHRAASVGLFMWAAPPLVFDYLSGSFLRWDWLFALGLAACFLKQKRYGWAGGFFGFAVATKLFPLFFGIALGIRALFAWRETKALRKEYVHFGISAAAVGATAVALSALPFGADAWKEYAQRIQVAQVEKFYAIQYSLRSVYLQHAAQPMAAWAQTIFPPDLAQRRADVELCATTSDSNTGPRCGREFTGCGDGHRYALDCSAEGQCTCAKDGVVGRSFSRDLPCAQSGGERARLFEQECGYPQDYSMGFLVARVLFSLLIIVLIRRASDVESFLLGPLLVFTWLTVNMYYWNMLGLLALGLMVRADRPSQKPAFGMLIGLHVVFMVFYLYQHLNRGLTEGYAVAWLLTVLIAGTSAWEGAYRRFSSDAQTEP